MLHPKALDAKSYRDDLLSLRGVQCTELCAKILIDAVRSVSRKRNTA